MTRQPVLARRAEDLLGSAVAATSPVAGGDICTATKLRLSDGRNALMKTNAQAPADFFHAEARSLERLASVGARGAAVGEVLAVADDCLIIAWIEPGKPTTEAAAAFGAGLAHTHAAGRDQPFGGPEDGYIGRLPLPNRTASTWAEFYATRRVLPYLKLARDRGNATADDAAAIESLVGRLSALVPEEPPALLHGDLWNGNVLWSSDPLAGDAAHLIDPAAHVGHREGDLAMMALFGMPHLTHVLAAYEEASADLIGPLADGWEDRIGLHQLFPLLTHAAMFGGGYAGRAASIARSL